MRPKPINQHSFESRFGTAGGDTVECNEPGALLRRNEEFDEEGSAPSEKLEVKQVGVLGARSLQMNLSPKPTLSPNSTPKEPKDGPRGMRIDIGEELSGYRLRALAIPAIVWLISWGALVLVLSSIFSLAFVTLFPAPLYRTLLSRYGKLG